MSRDRMFVQPHQEAQDKTHLNMQHQLTRRTEKLLNLQRRYYKLFADGYAALTETPANIYNITLLYRPDNITITQYKNFNICDRNQMASLRQILIELHAKITKYQPPLLLISNPYTVEQIVTCLQNSLDGRIPKTDPRIKDLNLEYSIYKWGGQYYAIDHGQKYNNILGQGGFGVVKRVQNIQAPNVEAVLKIQLPYLGQPYEIDRIRNELAIIQRLHPNAGMDNVAVIQRENNDGVLQYEFIMPRAHGIRLAEFTYNTESPPTSSQRLDAALAVIHAYANLHAAGVLHRDINIANVFYDPITNTATFIDFGLAYLLLPGQTAVTAKRFMPFGHPAYNAPEFIDPASSLADTRYKKENTYNVQTEIFSLGVTLAETLFPHTLVRHVVRVYVDEEHGTYKASYKPIEQTLQKNSIADMKINLINRMMDHDPTRRPALLEVIQALDSIKLNENALEKTMAQHALFKPSILYDLSTSPTAYLRPSADFAPSPK